MSGARSGPYRAHVLYGRRPDREDVVALRNTLFAAAGQGFTARREPLNERPE